MANWILFGVGFAAVSVAGMVLWRRWRRWNPEQGTSDEAQAAEARLWATKNQSVR